MESLSSIIYKALSALRRGGVIAFPTDTVYGFAADMVSREAVERLYSLKRRPRNKPVPVMLARIDTLSSVAEFIPEEARRLIKAHWPGALTIVLRKSTLVPEWVAGGGATVAARIPNHSIALEMLERFGKPLAVTSANISGRGSLKTYDEIKEVFGNGIDIIVPGETVHGMVSTVVDFTTEPPRVLRKGVVKVEF